MAGLEEYYEDINQILAFGLAAKFYFCETVHMCKWTGVLLCNTAISAMQLHHKLKLSIKLDSALMIYVE